MRLLHLTASHPPVLPGRLKLERREDGHPATPLAETSYSWWWAFGIDTPFGIAVVARTLLLVPEFRDLPITRRM